MYRKILSDMVKDERSHRNLSQEDLAEKAKISLRTVSDIENGKGNPRLDTLVALVTYLDLSFDAILKHEDVNDVAYLNQATKELKKFPKQYRQTAIKTLQGLLNGLPENNQ